VSPNPPALQCDLEHLLQALTEQGLADADKARMISSLVSKQDRRKLHPLELIAMRNWPHPDIPGKVLDLDFLTDWLAQQGGLSRYHFDPLKMDVSGATAVMSYAYAERFDILAVKVTPSTLTVAVSDPFRYDWLAELQRISKRQIERVLANPTELRNYRVEFYSISKAVDNAGVNRNEPSSIQNFEQLIELGKTGNFDADDQHIVSVVDWLLQYAYSQRASDIHIEPRRNQGNVRFRIDGVMHQVYEIPANITAAVLSRVKIMGRMDVAEKRKPQDGRIKTRSPNGVEIELRVSSMPTAFGEKLVLRVFDPEVLVKDFASLGFSAREEQNWNNMIGSPHGIVLVTGPTGSGKTTTLYTSLKQLARPEVNVCTIEDPIELIEPSFNQMQVQANIDLDFASGVRTLLRQDPDIIMIGEIRDEETAEMAVQAALTGHLVLSTLHTNDAPSAIARLLEIGVPSYLINATVVGVVAQRLVRSLCPHCKAPVETPEARWRSMIQPFKTEMPTQVYEAQGCLECRQTGYQGRVGIYEMLMVDDALRQLVLPDMDLTALRKQAIRQGMRPLNLDGAQKVANGVTTIDEVLRVAPPTSSYSH